MLLNTTVAELLLIVIDRLDHHHCSMLNIEY